MYQIGLLLLTGPVRLVLESISRYLKCANENVIKRLYVKLEPEFSKPLTKSEVLHLKRLSYFVPLVYNKASSLCKNLDVRIILTDTKKRKIELDNSSKFDVVLTNSEEDDKNIVNYLDHYFKDTCPNVIKLQEENVNDPLINYSLHSEFQIYKTVCLGGTFDRLHNGHKVLLSEAALRATEKLIVGITDGPMIKRKVLWELIEPIQKRITDVRTFLLDVDPSLHYEVVPITDPYGPTITNPDINCIVVSAETRKGGEKVNAERNSRGMNELSMYVVDLVENTDKIAGEEDKLSSSTRRMHLLGTCLRAPVVSSSGFYSIFLQGQPLTGKSCISKSFKNLGIVTIYCSELIKTILSCEKDLKDIFVHKFCYELPNINGTFDYKKLICLCLKDKEKRQFFASNVSERVNAKVRQELLFHRKRGVKIIIVQDSILLDGNLKCCDFNELWSTVIPVTEIAKRLSNFYDLTEEEATSIALCMPSNEWYIEKSNRIFCNLWSSEITENQVSRAWSELQLKCQ